MAEFRLFVVLTALADCYYAENNTFNCVPILEPFERITIRYGNKNMFFAIQIFLTINLVQMSPRETLVIPNRPLSISDDGWIHSSLRPSRTAKGVRCTYTIVAEFVGDPLYACALLPHPTYQRFRVRRFESYRTISTNICTFFMYAFCV